MPREQKEPLRSLTNEERAHLEQIARAQSWPAAQVARAKALLAVAEGRPFTQAAQAAGRRSGDAVARLVAGFNSRGVAAVVPGHGGGPRLVYGPDRRERILAHARRAPDREKDGTATRSLKCLQRALRTGAPGLSALKFSTRTIWCVLHGAGLSWQKSRTWCETGSSQRLHKKRDGTAQVVTVTDPDAEAKRK